MHGRKGEKSSDRQLPNILCIDPLLPYRHPPTAMPPGISYHMLVWIFSTHSSFHSNQASIYLFPSLLPLLSAFFHPESDLQFSQSIQLSRPLLKLCGRIAFEKVWVLRDRSGSRGPNPLSGYLQLLSGPIKPLSDLLPFLHGPISPFIPCVQSCLP